MDISANISDTENAEPVRPIGGGKKLKIKIRGSSADGFAQKIKLRNAATIE